MNFIQAAAHDLRNPLSVTLSSLQMLSKELGEGSEFYQEIIDMALHGLDRMQDLIDSLLNLEHIQSGVGLQCKPIDVRDLIERGVIDVQHNMQQRGQRLHLDVPERTAGHHGRYALAAPGAGESVGQREQVHATRR